jgi:hypothetical protein
MFFNADQWDDLHRRQLAAAMRATPAHDDVVLTKQERDAYWCIAYGEGEMV